MRGYSTSRALGKIYSKSPVVGSIIIMIMLCFAGGLFISFDMGMNGLGWCMIILGIAIFIITLVSKIASKKAKEKREQQLQEALISTGIDQVENISPYEFEEWVARFFRMHGYDATATQKSRDYGADVIIKNQGVISTVISVKKYTNPLGIKCVQELIGAMDYYQAVEGWVVSTAPSFTSQAKKLAETRNIKLYNKEDLAFMLKELQDNYNNGTSPTIKHENVVNLCENCGYQLFPEDKECPHCHTTLNK